MHGTDFEMQTVTAGWQRGVASSQAKKVRSMPKTADMVLAVCVGSF